MDTMVNQVIGGITIGIWILIIAVWCLVNLWLIFVVGWLIFDGFIMTMVYPYMKKEEAPKPKLKLIKGGKE